MANDKRDVVQVLERELSFLESGWYDPSPATSWRAPLIFADSPTCPNFTDRVPSRPCSECVLMQFVPLRHFGEKAPCRHSGRDRRNLISLGEHERYQGSAPQVAA